MEVWAFAALGAVAAVAVVVRWAMQRRRVAAWAAWAAQEDLSSTGFPAESTPRPGAQRGMLNYVLPAAGDVVDATMECAVAGIDRVGMCGEHRQELVRCLAAGQELVLWRRTGGKHAEGAVAVFTLDAKDIGHLPAEAAGRVAAALDRGRAATARVVGVDAFTSATGERLLGARLALTFYR